MNSGILYDSRLSPAYGEIVINISAPAEIGSAAIRSSSRAMSRLGMGLMVAGFAGIILTMAPVIRHEVGYRMASISTPKVEVTGLGELAMEAKAAAAAENDEKAYAKQVAQEFGITDTKFYLYIPKIDARAPIVANVNPGAEDTFREALKFGIAHAQGSSVPSEPGSTFLFAHSTDSPLNFAQYNAIFYLLHTIKPEDRDEIYVFYNDKLYKYKIEESHIVDADDTSWLLDKTEGKRLILQTCWPPGTSWKRLIVVASPIEE